MSDPDPTRITPRSEEEMAPVEFERWPRSISGTVVELKEESPGYWRVVLQTERDGQKAVYIDTRHPQLRWREA